MRDLFTDTSLCPHFTGDSSRASSVWSPTQVWSVQSIRWDEQHTRRRLMFNYEILTFPFWLQSIMNWAKSHPAYNSDSKLFFFSFVAFACGQMTSYPLAVIRTQQQAQGNINCDILCFWLFQIMFTSPVVLFSSFLLRFTSLIGCSTRTSGDIWETWN